MHQKNQRLEGLDAVNRVVVDDVTFFPLLVLLVALGPLVVTFDNFLALEVVGFMKLKLALGVVLLALLGLEGVKVIVALEVILIGLDLMLGVEMVGFIRPLVLLKSCWLEKIAWHQISIEVCRVLYKN